VDDDSVIRRRRSCSECNGRFTTMERVQLVPLKIIKKQGEYEVFERDKLAKSFYLALHKRPVSGEKVERVVNSLVRQLETMGETEIPSKTIGELVMESLADLDTVAYVRFASIYFEFSSASDFQDFVRKKSTS